jgi:hypothetical protein
MPSLSYNSSNQESFAVKYWNKSEGYLRQVTQIVYCKKKDEHEAAAQFVMQLFNITKEDVISVKYQ